MMVILLKKLIRYTRNIKGLYKLRCVKLLLLRFVTKVRNCLIQNNKLWKRFREISELVKKVVSSICTVAVVT